MYSEAVADYLKNIRWKDLICFSFNNEFINEHESRSSSRDKFVPIHQFLNAVI